MMRTCLFGILTVAMLSGCGTLLNLGAGTPYGGLVHDIEYARHGGGYVEDFVLRPMAAIDVPFSAVADTATLPIELIVLTGKSTKAWIEQKQKLRQQEADERWRRELESGTLPPQCEPEPATLAPETP